MSVTVGLSVPWDLWDLDAAARRGRLASIADAGIDHLFTADHISFHDGSGMDAPVLLAALSGIEPRLDLHAGVILLALRHPMVAACQIATLAQAAPGRLSIGVGVGGEDRHEFEVCGIDPATAGLPPGARRQDSAMPCASSRDATGLRTVDGDTRCSCGSASVPTQPRVGRTWQPGWNASTRFPSNDSRSTHRPATQNRFAEYLRPYVDAGATTLNLTPCGTDRDVEYATIAAVRTIFSS